MDETLILGGGPAGASLAIRLARAGWPVRLIEAEAGPHDKVCGEFLSFEAEHYLGELGLDPLVLGATVVRNLALCHGSRRASTMLPFRALSLSRRVMDEALLVAATDAGAAVMRGRRAARLEPAGPGWRVRLDDGEIMEAARVVLATGKHDLRGYPRPPGPQHDLIGFKQHWRLTPAEAKALEGLVELHLFPGGYAGFQTSGNDGGANLCLVVTRDAFAAAGRNWDGLLAALMTACPRLARRLDPAEPETKKPLAIGRIPYGHVQRRSDGLWRLGDQAAVISSCAGEGMSIAFHSARLAAEVMMRNGTASQFQRDLAQRLGRQVFRATCVSQVLVRPWGQRLASVTARLVSRSLAAVSRATRIQGALQMGSPDKSSCFKPSTVAELCAADRFEIDGENKGEGIRVRVERAF